MNHFQLKSFTVENKNRSISKQRKQSVPCTVCALPSTGKHYGAYSCGGCRNFFRRSQTIHASYQCNHSKKVNFQKCKMCRFKACIDAGMRMETSSKSGEVGENGSSNWIQQTTKQEQQQSRVRMLTEEFQEKLIELVNRFIFMTENIRFISILDGVTTEANLIFNKCINKLEQDIHQVSHLVRSMPGMSSKVAVADRVTIFTKAVFPILIFRSFSQPNCFDPLCTLFGIDQSTAALLFQNFNQQNIAYLHQYLSQLNYEFQTLQFNEQEIAMIFGLLCFDYNLLANTFMDNRQAVQSVATIYAQLSEALSESTFGRAQQIQQFVTKLAQVHSPMVRLAQDILFIQGERCQSVLIRELVFTL